MASAYSRPIPEVFTDLITQLASLVRKEGQLARTEMSEKLARVLTGMAMIVGGAVLLIPGLVILLQAAIVGLIQSGMNPPLAALLVGGLTLAIGAVLVLAGRGLIKPEALVPDKTLDQLSQDAAMAKRVAGTSEEWTEQRGPKAMRPTIQETGNGYDQQRSA